MARSKNKGPWLIKLTYGPLFLPILVIPPYRLLPLGAAGGLTYAVFVDILHRNKPSPFTGQG